MKRDKRHTEQEWPKRRPAGSGHAVNYGKAHANWRGRANKPIGPAGVFATACRHRGPDATRETPAVIGQGRGQLATRERQAGPSGVAERLAVPMKPGNAGGGKGP